MDDLIEKLNILVNDFTQKYAGEYSVLVKFALLIAAALVTLFVFFSLANFLRHRRWITGKFSMPVLMADYIEQTISIVIKIFALVLALQIIGAGSIVGTIVGTAGVLGLGISFAFKDIIENYIAGIILSFRQPFLKGEHIEVDGSEGIVQRMTSRMTMIKTFDGNNISIPNATIFKSKIINYSRIPERRFEFKIGINPESDPDQARSVGLKAMDALEEVLDDPTPIAVTDEVGDSSIVIKFLGWVDQNKYDFFLTRSAAIGRVKNAIEEEGIEIPDPSFIVKLRQPGEQKDMKAFKKSIPLQDELISSENKQSSIIFDQIKKEEVNRDLLNSATTE
ncbi:MAG: hypothetical protein CME62_06330 [Halobacteriovoraceae bacterium]|nr:hypothetical protein [Halobacteriovoraceae bacterium]|tara:strand:- start:13792 stop:14799 length:1008 start_codon:yes stop_codon:yes gene_type:complete